MKIIGEEEVIHLEVEGADFKVEIMLKPGTMNLTPVKEAPLGVGDPMGTKEEALGEEEEVKCSQADVLHATKPGISHSGVLKKVENPVNLQIGESICCKKKRMGKVSHPITPQPPDLLILKLENVL